MSGGVDSSVAACLLVERGYQVIGLFMRVGMEQPHECNGHDDGLPGRSRSGCCSAADARDAHLVAGMLGIPLYALDFKSDFEPIIDYFVDEYAVGRTPNPCIVCNEKLKFGKMVEYADAVGAKYIATGHYARIQRRDSKPLLTRGVDHGKDQSYVLFGLDRPVFDRVMFPVGELTKKAVREHARRLGLHNRDKPDSMEICFVPDNDHARLLRERRPEIFVEGDVVDDENNVVGRHRGAAQYTIGQRRGLGIAAGKPIYVTRIDTDTNTITVGGRDALLSSVLIADRVNFLADPPSERFRAHVQIRYQHRAAPATVCRMDESRVRVVFDQPQSAITPGQASVIYDGDVVVGGGWIEQAEGRVDTSVKTPHRADA